MLRLVVAKICLPSIWEPIDQDSGSAWSREIGPARRLGQALGGWACGRTRHWHRGYSHGIHMSVVVAASVCVVLWSAGGQAGMDGFIQAADKSVALSPHSFGMESRVPDSRARNQVN